MKQVELEQLLYLLRRTPEETIQTFQSLARDLRLEPPRQTNPIPAAVLIPIVNHNHQPSILLTQRTNHLNHHAGQVSFPGGRIDESDLDAKACAIREAQEEVGLEPENIQILGCLGEWPSFSGYLVTPFVGLVTPPLRILPCEREVEEVFEIPVSEAFNLKRYERITKETPYPHDYYQMTYQNKRIWGFTATLLVLLAHFGQIH